MNSYKKFLMLILAAGLVISIYLTYVHYNVSALVCPTTGVINCESVLGSSFATVLGIPIALAAVFWFIVAIYFAGRKNWFNDILGLAAIAAVIYSFTSMSIIGKICIYCTAVDAILIAYILIIFLGQKRLHG